MYNATQSTLVLIDLNAKKFQLGDTEFKFRWPKKKKNTKCYAAKYFIIYWSTYLGPCLTIIDIHIKTLFIATHHTLYPYIEEWHRLWWGSRVIGIITILILEFMVNKENFHVQMLITIKFWAKREIEKLFKKWSVTPVLAVIRPLNKLIHLHINEPLILWLPYTSSIGWCVSAVDTFRAFKICMTERTSQQAFHFSWTLFQRTTKRLHCCPH